MSITTKFSVIGVRPNEKMGTGDKAIKPSYLLSNVAVKWDSEWFPSLVETAKVCKSDCLRKSGKRIVGYSAACFEGGIRAENVINHGFAFIDIDGKEQKEEFKNMDINYLRDIVMNAIGIGDYLIYYSVSGNGNHIIVPYTRQMSSNDHICAQAELIERLEMKGLKCDRATLDIARKIFVADKALDNYRFMANGKGYERRTVGDEILTTIKADLKPATLKNYKSNTHKAIDDAMTKKVDNFLRLLEAEDLIGGYWLDWGGTWFNIHSAKWENASTPMNNYYGAGDSCIWKKRSGEFIGKTPQEFWDYLKNKRKTLESAKFRL